MPATYSQTFQEKKAEREGGNETEENDKANMIKCS